MNRISLFLFADSYWISESGRDSEGGLQLLSQVGGECLGKALPGRRLKAEFVAPVDWPAAST